MESISVLLGAEDPASRSLLERCLAEWEYQVTSAQDGDAAQELLQETRFDICILDWELPGISGFEICRRIRDNRSETSPLVVLLASQEQVEDIMQEAQNRNEASANNYIIKPIDLKHLRHRLAGLAQIVLLKRDVRTERIKKIDWTGGPKFS